MILSKNKGVKSNHSIDFTPLFIGYILFTYYLLFIFKTFCINTQGSQLIFLHFNLIIQFRIYGHFSFFYSEQIHIIINFKIDHFITIQFFTHPFHSLYNIYTYIVKYFKLGVKSIQLSRFISFSK